MPRTRALRFSIVTWVVIFWFLATITPAFAAPKEIVLYSFCSQAKCTDGYQPSSSLIIDAAGNLYGTTLDGGAYGGGVVFQLTPGAGGVWTENVVYNFCPVMYQCSDGLAPSSLIVDAAGNLYGATTEGGYMQNPYCGGVGCGTVFQLKSTSNGWTEKVLYKFGRHQGDDDGIYPVGALAFDAAGNLYGTTNQGGTALGSAGTVFQLSPAKNGEWTEKVLQSFSTLGGGGEFPVAGMTISPSGRLCGTTENGGTYKCAAAGCGTVFQLTSGKHGNRTARIIHFFNGSDGYWPFSVPAFDAAGNLYLTTPRGGAGGRDNGTVVELTHARRGNWTEKVLHSFYQPSGPLGGVVLDARGNLYGTTWEGGSSGNGTAFELSDHANGGWVLTRLHNFGGSGDGVEPASTLIFDTHGNLYGTTQRGGISGGGIVFEITP